MDLRLDEFGLLGGDANVQNFMRGDPTMDLVQFMQGTDAPAGGLTANFPTIGLTNVVAQGNESLLQQQLATAQQQIATLQQQLDVQGRQLAAFQNTGAQIASLNATIDKQAEQLREYDENLSKLIVETETMAAENARLKQQLFAGVPAPPPQPAPDTASAALVEQVVLKLNRFIEQTDKGGVRIDRGSACDYLDLVLENCAYLLRKQSKSEQELSSTRLQNQRLREICQQNLTLLRLRYEQLFGCRLNVTGVDTARLVRPDTGQWLDFVDVNGELRLVGSSYLAHGQESVSVRQAVLGLVSPHQ